jgi:acyl-CoA thioesterase I
LNTVAQRPARSNAPAILRGVALALSLASATPSGAANDPLSEDACRPAPGLAARIQPERLSRLRARLSDGGPLRLLAIGSSSTSGVGASSPAFAYPAQLEQRLRRRFPLQQIAVINAGVAGETAAATLARLPRELAAERPDLTLWQLGTNDALNLAVDEKTFASQIERGVDLIEANGGDLIVVDPQFYPAAADPARYERFVALIDAAARRRRVNLFSRFRLMQYWRGVGALADKPATAPDGLHMNDHGYACLAGLIEESLAAALGR